MGYTLKRYWSSHVALSEKANTPIIQTVKVFLNSGYNSIYRAWKCNHYHKLEDSILGLSWIFRFNLYVTAESQADRIPHVHRHNLTYGHSAQSSSSSWCSQPPVSSNWCLTVSNCFFTHALFDYINHRVTGQLPLCLVLIIAWSTRMHVCLCNRSAMEN